MLKNVDCEINNGCFSYTSQYQDCVPSSFACKLVCVNDKFSKYIVLYRGKNAVLKFIQCIFKEYSYCKDVIKKHFNKNLVMTAEQNEEFERSNICWICIKLIDIGDNKVRDHDYTKNGNNYRGAAHWSCNIKSAHSGLRQFLAAESPLEMMKNAFCFKLEFFIFLKMILFISC